MKKIIYLFLLVNSISFAQTGITPLNQWKTNGNAISTNTNFIGTTTNRSLLCKTNNVQRLKIDSLGLLSLSTNTNTSTLINGSFWYNLPTINGFQYYSNDATNSGYHSVFSNSTAALGIYLSNVGGTKVQIGTQTNDDLGFFTGTGSVKMRINKNGNVGINLTSDPTSTFHVQGNAAITSTLGVGGNSYFGNNSTAPTAKIHLAAGSTAASSAPIKFTSGALMTTAEAGAVEYNGTTLFFTPSGTNRYQVGTVLTATGVLDFVNTAAQTSSELTITVTGAAVGDAVSVGLPAAPNANSAITGYVSAANTVTLRFNNYSAAAIDPASATYKATVIKN